MFKIFIYKNYKKILVGIIITLGLIIFYFKSFPVNHLESTSDNNSLGKFTSEQKQQTYYIDIMGQVVNPGVYELKSNTLVIEAIEIAGGFASNADVEYVHKYLLLSATIKPSQKIYIPMIGEDISNIIQNTVTESSNSDVKINLNTANKETLKTITGVGDVTAEKIIELRPIQSMDQLKNLVNVPAKTIDNIISKSEL